MIDAETIKLCPEFDLMPKRSHVVRRRGRRRGVGKGTPSARFNMLLKPLCSELKTSRIVLSTALATATASGGGVIAGNLTVDPTLTTYTELTDIKALYSSYRLLAAELILTRIDGNTTAATIYLGSLLNTGIGNPSAASQVIDNANHMVWVPGADTTGRARRICLSGNKRINFQEWGTTATDSAGAPGGWYWYGSGFTASQPAFTYYARTIFEVRNRV